MGFGASGSLAKAVTHSTWRGITYARSYAAPAYSRTTTQDTTRTAFSWLNSVYKIMGPLALAPWDAFATGKKFIGRNAFIQQNLATLRTATDLSVFIMSPGALGGLPASSAVVTPGSGQLSVAVTVPSNLPDGWTVSAVRVIAIADQDPQSDALYTTYEGEDASNPYTVVLAGLDTVLHRVFAYVKYLRPDGKVAYSPSIESSGTPT